MAPEKPRIPRDKKALGRHLRGQVQGNDLVERHD